MENCSVILFDQNRTNLLPLAYTRAIAKLRCGIFTIQEKWDKWLNTNTLIQTEEYLQEDNIDYDTVNLFIYGGLLPDEKIVQEINQLQEGEALVQDGIIIAQKSKSLQENCSTQIQVNKSTQIKNLWDIFKFNGEQIEQDVLLLNEVEEIKSNPEKGVFIYGKHKVLAKRGVKIRPCNINTEKGTVYLGENAEIMEGVNVRGPFALCDNSTLKMAAKIYGDTTIGPHSKVGGEVGNSVILGYSNKGHDGYLGNSVIGEWCNLGADTNNSNLKNNYANVRLWNYGTQRFVDTGLQFCGLIMGDHSKCSINTMFNTGTVVGVFANIFGTGFPRNFVPSYAWGGSGGMMTYKTNKAFEVAEKVMERRTIELTDRDKNILNHIFETSAQFRVWEKQK